jgi:ribosomal protein S11
MVKTKTTTEKAPAQTEVKAPVVKVPKKKVVAGTLHIEATFNNTKIVVSDKSGNTLFWTSSGALGFKGAKKGTPFAKSLALELIDASQETGVAFKKKLDVYKNAEANKVNARFARMNTPGNKK